MLLNLEGLDGAGKTTQARLLTDCLEARGMSVRVIHFPAYETPTGERIAAFLRGDLALDAAAVQELFAANRREKLPDLLRALAEHDLVILDRYYPSAWAYGIARGFGAAWLESLDAGLPVPEIVVVLDVPVETVVRRMAARGPAADRYEKDAAFLNAVREAYLRLAAERGWSVIPNERGPAEIAEDLLALLFARGLGGGAATDAAAPKIGIAPPAPL